MHSHHCPSRSYGGHSPQSSDTTPAMALWSTPRHKHRTLQVKKPAMRRIATSAAWAFALSFTAHAVHADGLLRSLCNMTVSESSLPCDLQMYNISAFRSELNQLKLAENCQAIEARSTELLKAMGHTNAQLCSHEEMEQIGRWKQRLEKLNTEIRTGDAPYCGATQTGKLQLPSPNYTR